MGILVSAVSQQTPADRRGRQQALAESRTRKNAQVGDSFAAHLKESMSRQAATASQACRASNVLNNSLGTAKTPSCCRIFLMWPPGGAAILQR